MMRLASKLSIGAAALLISAGLAMAQTAPQPATPKAPAAAAPKAAEKATKGVPKKASTPEGIECSKQADEKKLHGKERKTFRAKCVRDLKKAAAPAKAPEKKKN